MVSVFSRRVIAYFLDFFVVSAFMWIVSYLISLVVRPSNYYDIVQYYVFIVPILIFVYFVFCEKFFGATIGKALLYLQVKSKNGADISWPQAIIRNLTKIYWVPIIFDWIIGRFLNTDRILNNITKTIVIDELY